MQHSMQQKKVKNQKAFYKGFSSKQDLAICGFVPVRLTVVFSFLFSFSFYYIIYYIYYIELFFNFFFNSGEPLFLIVPLFKGGYGG